MSDSRESLVDGEVTAQPETLSPVVFQRILIETSSRYEISSNDIDHERASSLSPLRYSNDHQTRARLSLLLPRNARQILRVLSKTGQSTQSPRQKPSTTLPYLRRLASSTTEQMTKRSIHTWKRG